MKTFSDHGGSVRLGKRKVARPFDPRKPQHVTLRSDKARGKLSLAHPNFKSRIEVMVYMIADKRNVRVYRFVNARTHLHLILYAKERSEIQNYYRELASKVAKMILPEGGKFWSSIVYSKLISWGRQFENVNKYLIQNELEFYGFIPYQSRANGKKDFVILKCEEPPRAALQVKVIQLPLI